MKRLQRLTVNVIKTFMLVILTFSFVQLSKINSIEAAQKTKEYPVRDKELPTYETVTEIPDIVYSTPASENGLNGNCYCITGKIKGVYTGLSKLCKAMKIKYDSSDADPMMEKIKYILVKTDKGYVVIYDLYSYIAKNMLEAVESDEITNGYMKALLDSYVEKYVYFKPYKEYPQKGEKVRICATYKGFSSVTQTPTFYYGINQYSVEACKGEKTVNLNPETKTFKLDNIKMEIPKDWVWYTVGDEYKYFYSDDGFVMVSSVYLSGYPLNDYIVDSVIYDFLSFQNMSLKHTSTKKTEYKNKPISEYYTLQFKGTSDGEKCKIRTTLFEYKGDLYTVSYFSNLTEHSDDYFDIYKKIIKSIKPLK